MAFRVRHTWCWLTQMQLVYEQSSNAIWSVGRRTCQILPKSGSGIWLACSMVKVCSSPSHTVSVNVLASVRMSVIGCSCQVASPCNSHAPNTQESSLSKLACMNQQVAHVSQLSGCLICESFKLIFDASWLSWSCQWVHKVLFWLYIHGSKVAHAK